MTVMEMTASTFLVGHDGDRWRLGLAWHRRLGGWLPTGGHQDDDETVEQTAVREAREEAGVEAQLLSLPLPNSFPHPAVAAPWWIVDVPADPDNHTPTLHVHRDHVFVGVVDLAAPVTDCESAVAWFTREELARAAEVAEDSRLQGLQVLTHLEQFPSPIDVSA